MDYPLLWEIIFNVVDENDLDIWEPIRRREIHLRIQNFYEDVVLFYSLTDFQSHFRIEKRTFERLVQYLGPRLWQNEVFPKTPPEKQVAIALWVLGNQEVYRSVADRFGVSKDSVWRCTFDVANALLQDVQNFIRWPAAHEVPNIEEEFARVSGFPGVVGAIDGCHIQISAPVENPDSYINRKGFHSIILQGICDHRMRFIDVFSGMCGSVHDARVWRCSDIKALIDNNENRYFPEQTHLLGDSAYPLCYRLLTPYRDDGHLNHLQRNYNTKLSKTRVIIERAFGMLKGRFRKLKYVYVHNTEMIPLLIVACCILHNICIEDEDMIFDNVPMNVEEIANDNGNEAIMEGAIKRDVIANRLL